jgi:hypothetical protein
MAGNALRAVTGGGVMVPMGDSRIGTEAVPYSADTPIPL